MTDLLQLAERVEKATGPDRELDVLIRDTVFHPCINPGAEYTASLDAAMTLVPEGAAYRLYSWPKQTEGDRACVLVEGGQETWAATPALALCAASLRSRAQTNVKGVPLMPNDPMSDLLERLEHCPFCGEELTVRPQFYDRDFREQEPVYLAWHSGVVSSDAPCIFSGKGFYQSEWDKWNTRAQSAEIERLQGEVERRDNALTDARNNILSLLGGFRDDMPDAAVKLFQAQAKQIEATLQERR